MAHLNESFSAAGLARLPGLIFCSPVRASSTLVLCSTGETNDTTLDPHLLVRAGPFVFLLRCICRYSYSTQLFHRYLSFLAAAIFQCNVALKCHPTHTFFDPITFIIHSSTISISTLPPFQSKVLVLAFFSFFLSFFYPNSLYSINTLTNEASYFLSSRRCLRLSR